MNSKTRSQQQQQQQQQYSTGAGQPRQSQQAQRPSSSSASRQQQQQARKQQQRNVEEQLKQEQRAALKASFGAQATRLKLTVYFILTLALLLLGLAFFSYNWLEVERRFYGSRFKRLGLWRMCFNSFSAPDDYQFRKFYVGCRWIFADEYKPIRKFLLPAFFIATQILFTAGFLLAALVGAAIIAIHQCFIIERPDNALRTLAIASLLSAFSSTTAVIIFAINANRPDWMPDPDQNYLSWSFAAALIGSCLTWIVALLFYIDLQLTIRRELRQVSHPYGTSR